MTPPRRVITEVAEVNPSLPRALASDLERHIDFVPMADLSEEGLVHPKETRLIRDVVRGYTYFENCDVIVAKITPCMENGKAAYVDNLPTGVGFGSTEFHVLRPRRDVNGRYLFWMIWGPHFRQTAHSNMTGSAGQKRVPASFFGRYEIPMPPLAEQGRIAAILDAANSLRMKRRTSIGQLDSLMQATFLEMFGDPVTNPKGWALRSLDSVCDMQVGFAFPSKDFANAREGRALCRGINVGLGSLDWKERKDWVEAGASKIDKYELEVGDIVLAMDRPWISNGLKIAVVSHDDLPSLLVQRVCRIRCRDPLARPLAYCQLVSDAFRRHCTPTETTIPHISPIEVKEFPVIVPPIDLQARFAAIAGCIEQQKARLKTHLTQLDALIGSLQAQAFSGERLTASHSSQHASA